MSQVIIRERQKGQTIPAWDADGMMQVRGGLDFDNATDLGSYDGPSVDGQYDADALTYIQLPDGGLYYVLNIDLA